ncbi:MAG: hypothetical protein AAGF73_03120 [Actinomycetota bacterium]
MTSAASVRRGSETSIVDADLDELPDTAGRGAHVVSAQLANVVRDRATSVLVDFADRLPRDVTGYVGAEVRLDDPTNDDFLAYVNSADAIGAVPAALATPSGADLDRLDAAPSTAPPGLSKPLEHGWLERDLSRGNRNHPSVFAAPKYGEAGELSAGSAYAALSGSSPPPAMAAGIDALDRTNPAEHSDAGRCDGRTASGRLSDRRHWPVANRAALETTRCR